ncbi:hypothetical protein [Streptomyces sp. NPDC055085]
MAGRLNEMISAYENLARSRKVRTPTPSVGVGVEGTSSYGSGFTHTARQAGLAVVEVNRPDKAERRRIGKSDPIDAYAAARAVISRRATSAPKNGAIVGIRALHTAARSCVPPMGWVQTPPPSC